MGRRIASYLYLSSFVVALGGMRHVLEHRQLTLWHADLSRDCLVGDMVLPSWSTTTAGDIRPTSTHRQQSSSLRRDVTTVLQQLKNLTGSIKPTQMDGYPIGLSEPSRITIIR